MQKELVQALDLSCPSCTGREFELRVLRDEDLAAARCVSCNRDFLLLDSEDYWFDAIQATYPRPRRCSCKGKSFKLKCEYFYRDDGEVKSVDLWSVCPSCETTKHEMSIDIDYGEAEDLVGRPLRFCKTPNLRYDLKETSLYLERADMASIVSYLSAVHHCTFLCQLRENDSWVYHTLDVEGTQRAILSGRYLHIYASLGPLDPSELEGASVKKEDWFWKHNEIIRISSPICMHIGQEKGLLYYIRYSNEYIENDIAVSKGANFCSATAALLQWLNVSFVSWRGRLCFDNATEHIRLFGDKYSKNRTSQHRCL